MRNLRWGFRKGLCKVFKIGLRNRHIGVSMEECEVCGRESGNISIIDIESVELRACPRCSEGKKVIRRPGAGAATRITMQQPKEEDKLVQDFGERMRKGREAMNLPLKVVAEMLNEKHSLLLRIEEQKTMPSVALTKKLERFLGIKLMEEKDIESTPSGQGKGGKATLGDFIVGN